MCNACNLHRYITALGRICSRCRRDLPIDHFHKNQKRCKNCQRTMTRAWRARLSVAALKGERKRRAERYLFERSDTLRRAVQFRRNTPVEYLLRHAKMRAAAKGLEFSLVPDDLEIPTICPALGIPLIQGDGKPTANSPTLDRIDNSKGYVPGNVAVISYRANRIKVDASAEELLLVLEYVRGRPRYG